MKRLSKKLPRQIEQITVARLQREGATATEALAYLLKCRRDKRQMSRVSKAAGIPANTMSRIVNKNGGTTLYTAERLAEAMGYRLTLEVCDETHISFDIDADDDGMRP